MCSSPSSSRAPSSEPRRRGVGLGSIRPGRARAPGTPPGSAAAAWTVGRRFFSKSENASAATRLAFRSPPPNWTACGRPLLGWLARAASGGREHDTTDLNTPPPPPRRRSRTCRVPCRRRPSLLRGMTRSTAAVAAAGTTLLLPPRTAAGELRSSTTTAVTRLFNVSPSVFSRNAPFVHAPPFPS